MHNGPVFAICVLKDGSVVTGGGKDGKLIHFDGNYKKSDLEAEVNKILNMFLSILNEYWTNLTGTLG